MRCVALVSLHQRGWYLRRVGGIRLRLRMLHLNDEMDEVLSGRRQSLSVKRASPPSCRCISGDCISGDSAPRSCFT